MGGGQWTLEHRCGVEGHRWPLVLKKSGRERVPGALGIGVAGVAAFSVPSLARWPWGRATHKATSLGPGPWLSVSPAEDWTILWLFVLAVDFATPKLSQVSNCQQPSYLTLPRADKGKTVSRTGWSSLLRLLNHPGFLSIHPQGPGAKGRGCLSLLPLTAHQVPAPHACYPIAPEAQAEDCESQDNPQCSETLSRNEKTERVWRGGSVVRALLALLGLGS